MRSRPLTEIAVLTTTEEEEAVGFVLERILGVQPSAYINFDTGAARVSVFLEKGTPKPATLKSLRLALAELNIHPSKILTRKVPREDWAESWKKHFPTLVIADRLLIRPSWSKQKPLRDQTVVTLDPGLSFGTGHHPTTAFCLEQILHHHTARRQLSLLDIGTGSGILAIAAAKLGYSPVVAFDFDPQAVRVAVRNGRVNGVSKHIHLSQADLTKLPVRSSKHYDVVCANLIDDLLIQERTRILNCLERGGSLVLAGILRTQFDRVRKAYIEAGCELVTTGFSGEWQSGAFVQRLRKR